MSETEESKVALTDDERRLEVPQPKVERLEEPLWNLLEQLKPHIDSGEYGMIIGEDTSGRIPALILQQAINGVYESKGLHALPIMFIQSSGKSKDVPKMRSEFNTRLAHFKKLNPSKKALIVTDTMDSGHSSANIGKLLHPGFPRKWLNGYSVDFDVASALSSFSAEDYHKKSIFPKNTRIFVGEPNAFIYSVDHVANKPYLSGLTRTKFLPTHTRFRDSLMKTEGRVLESDLDKPKAIDIRGNVARARNTARAVSQRLTQRYLAS